MAWTTAISDVTLHLSDGPTDKPAMQKALIGVVNGTNKIFKTFDARVLTNFTTSVAPFGVYVNDALVAVDAHDLESGFIVLHTAPQSGDTVHANYYHQWFNDTQLGQYLTSGAMFLNKGIFYDTLEEGLRVIALEYAKYLAYNEMAARTSRTIADTFRFEDGSGKDRSAEPNFNRMATACYDKAMEMRKDYYSGAGRQHIPSFVLSRGNVKDVAPNR